MLVEDDSRVHAVNYLREKIVEFRAGERQVEGGESPGIDTVEVRFKGSNSDHGRNGAKLARMKDGGNKGAEAVELYRLMKGGWTYR